MQNFKNLQLNTKKLPFLWHTEFKLDMPFSPLKILDLKKIAPKNCKWLYLPRYIYQFWFLQKFWGVLHSVFSVEPISGIGRYRPIIWLPISASADISVKWYRFNTNFLGYYYCAELSPTPHGLLV